MRDAKPERLVKALKDMGFEEAGGTKHLKMKCGENMVAVPMHGVIKSKTVERIRQQGKIDKKLFWSYKF